MSRSHYAQVDETSTHCVPSETKVHSHSVKSGFVQRTMIPTPLGVPGVKTGVAVLQQVPDGTDDDELDEWELEGLLLDEFELEGLELEGLLELALDEELGTLELLEETELLDETELLETLELLDELLEELLGTTQQHGNQPIIHTPLE